MARSAGVDFRLLLGLAAVGAGLYLVSKVWGVGKTVSAGVASAYTGAVNTTSDWLTHWFGPSLTGSDLYHTVIFPDLSSHAVAASIVDPSSGLFNWSGYPPGSQPEYTYQLQLIDGLWYAVT